MTPPSLPSEMGDTPRPLWRWWLFLVAIWLWGETGWEWARGLFGWCVLPEWLADDDELAAMDRGEVGDAF